MRRLNEAEYKRLVLSILKQIDKVCRDNEIKYFLYAGTLLGAVRHGGFIPWDDDVDIVVSREDYSKLSKLINEQCDNLQFISYEYNQDTVYPFGKICDTRTCVLEKNLRPVLGYGAFIDVFPLDYVSNNRALRYIECLFFGCFERMIMHSARIGFEKSESIPKNVARHIAFTICRHFNTHRLISLFNEWLKLMHKEKTAYMGLPWIIVYPSTYFDDTCEIEFEGSLFMAPSDADGVLTHAYGDYMQLPPLEKRQPLHTLACFIVEGENSVDDTNA